jgi:hypothetical protein
VSFQLGDFILHDIAGFDLEQSYQPIGGEVVRRAMSGRGIKQMTWQKLRVTTSGTGWIPAGIDSLDFSQQMTLKCVVPRSIPANFSTRQATLPAARRSDGKFIPYGLAIMPDGQAVLTAAAIAGNVATLDAVTGAVAYKACYYPQLTVWAFRPPISGNRAEAAHRWEVVCEEV